ncbi:MAG TPA: hypothetical protein VFF52_23205 [Isosphaeraceae bacterium]|nr:hypothetical protein [Isosphaeraceae bacterium]
MNRQLPAGYFAEPKVQLGIEIDAAAFEELEYLPSLAPVDPGGNGWVAPAPTQTIPLPILTDVVEVLVFDREGGPRLAGAIELVSPANKDRADDRDAFLTKCAAYLQQGLGLAFVDVVTSRRADLHGELLTRFGAEATRPLDAELVATSYRPVDRDGQPSLEIWLESVKVGEPLPSLPLWLRGSLCLHVDLDATDDRTCREQRILVHG